MLDQNNNWRSKFDSSSLENEDWLEPSDKLFGAIEEEVYGEKKKRRVVLPWLFMGMLFLAVVGYCSFSFFSEEATATSSEIISSNEKVNDQVTNSPKSKSTDIHTTDIKNQGAESVQEDDALVSLSGDEKEPKEQVSSQADGSNEQKINTAQKQIKNTSAQKTTASSIVNNNTARQTSAKTTDEIFIPTSTSVTNSSISTSSNNKSSKSDPSALITTAPSASLKKLSAIPLLVTLTAKPLGQQALSLKEADEYLNNILPASFSFAQQHPIPEEAKTQSFYLGGGVNFAKFVLNQNFNSAVSPADFTHTEGSGVAFSIGYEKGLSDKLNFFAELDYSRTVLNSGHNSDYKYSIATEQDGSQQVDLTMATPLGFMEGTVVIQRAGAVTDPEVDLVLDLSNQHSYSTAGINLGFNYNVFSLSKLDLGVDIGLGVQKLFGLTNQLTQVSTSNANFGASQTAIVSDQMSIRSWLPRSLLGLSIKRALSDRASIGLSYRYNLGLRAIHAEDNLSTSTGIREQRVHLILLQKF